jgi:hypothetical protein
MLWKDGRYAPGLFRQISNDAAHFELFPIRKTRYPDRSHASGPDHARVRIDAVQAAVARQ